MAVNKTAFVVGALGGASVAVAAMAGAGLKLPNLTAPHGGDLIQASTAPIFAPPPGAPESFADIFERVSPAVVSIHVTSKVDIQALKRSIPGFENFPFEIVPKGGADGDDSRPPPKQESSGSGFFISGDGYIVTNNHVVDGADDIKVVTKDGTELKATVVGRDEGTDLAVIKVQGAEFPLCELRDLGEAAGRRLGGRGRQPVRPAGHRHRRHHLGLQPQHRRELRRFHPDRRADQQGQLRRPDLRHLRPRDRRQRRDLLAHRRLGRHRFRHSGRHRPERDAAADRPRQDHPRLHRRDDRVVRPTISPIPGHSAAARARRSPT